MAINSFISTVWSETLYNSLEKEYIAVRNCNREFEGELKGNSSVRVCAVAPVSIFPYNKNVDMREPEVLSDEDVRIFCTNSRAFNFQIDDIDLAQSRPSIMQSAMRQAASALANDADSYVYSLFEEIPEANVITNEAVSPDNIIDTIIKVREKMIMNNINSNTKTVLEVSPAIASIILKANITYLTNNENALFNGYVGSFIGFDIYVSNNVASEDDFYKCYARTTRAISFAESINSVEAYRPENRFADAVKGLYYYGAQLIYPKEIFCLNVKPATV